MAERFEFCGPAVGPLPKEGFVAAWKSIGVGIAESMPDLEYNYRDIGVCPYDVNRVWVRSRSDWPRLAPRPHAHITPPQLLTTTTANPSPHRPNRPFCVPPTESTRVHPRARKPPLFGWVRRSTLLPVAAGFHRQVRP